MNLLKKVKTVYEQEGISGVSKKILTKARKKAFKTDIINFYKYTYDLPKIPLSQADIKNNPIKDNTMILNWIIPDLGVGSGGHINIFEFVNYFQSKGHKNRIYIFGDSRFKTDKSIQNFIYSNYNLRKSVELHRSTKGVKFAHATIATAWNTAYFVKSFDNTLKKFYFVQDFEPYFFAVGSEYFLAEQTYLMNFFGLTAGNWLKNKLSNDYGMKCESFLFSYNKALYKVIPKRDKIKRILFYARPVTPRRIFEIGLMALNVFHNRMPNVHIIFAGWDVSNYNIPFPYLNAGCVPLNKLGDLYSQCDIVLTLSGTNLSLLPLEVMSCGTAIMSNRGPNVEWLLNEDICILCDFNINDIALKLEQYLKDENSLNKIIENGYRFAAETNFNKEVSKLEKVMLKEVLANE